MIKITMLGIIFFWQSFIISSVQEALKEEALTIIQKYIPDNPNIIEAGARYGEDTLTMLKKWPSAHIYAFEPHPENFDTLAALLKHDHRVSLFRCALSEKTEQKLFFMSDDNPGASSLLPPTSICTEFFSVNPVPIPIYTITLNDWYDQFKPGNIDFMWLDMEGYELYALRHADILLPHVSALYIEVNFIPFRYGTCFYDDVVDHLKKYGFEPIWWSTDKRDFQADVIFIHTDKLSQK